LGGFYYNPDNAIDFPAFVKRIKIMIAIKLLIKIKKVPNDKITNVFRVFVNAIIPKHAKSYYISLD